MIVGCKQAETPHCTSLRLYSDSIEKALLYAIIVQPEDALVLIHKIQYPDIEQLTVTH